MAIKLPGLFTGAQADTEGYDDIDKFIKDLLNINKAASREELKAKAASQFPDIDDNVINSLIDQNLSGGGEGVPSISEELKPPEGFKEEATELARQDFERLQNVPGVQVKTGPGIFIPPPALPISNQTDVYTPDREGANQITDLEAAIKFAQENNLPVPKTETEWAEIKNYIPPYKLSDEQHKILQAAVPITQWNANAALWAGVPPEVIESAISAGGVNIGVVGWLPTDGYLRQFYENTTATLNSSLKLKYMGIAPGMFARLINEDYQARLDAGIIGQGGASYRELKGINTAIVEKDGIRFRASGEWILNEDTGEYDFITDGRFMMRELPTTLEEIEAAAVALMKTPEEYAVTKPTLPEGYTYGPVENTLRTPDGEIYFAKDEDEFNNLLIDIGALPSIEFKWPEYEFKFRSFNELKQLEATGKADAINDIAKELSIMVESELITAKDRQDYLSGKITLDQLNNKTGGLYADPLREEVPTPENLQQIRTEIEADPDNFYNILQDEGRTVKTENLLRLLGATEEDILAVYPGTQPMPRTIAEIQDGYEAINVDELADNLKLVAQSGETKEIAGMLREIGAAIKSPVDLEGWISDYESGKVTAARAIQAVMREYYIYSLNKIYEKGITEEGEFKFRYEKAAVADRNKVIELLKKLDVPDKYINLVLEGVISPAYLLDETKPITQKLEGFMGTLSEPIDWDRHFSANLMNLYLWVKMGDAERKGFWNINTNNPVSTRARYDMWDAPTFVKGTLEIISNPWYLIPIGGSASIGLKFGFKNISNVLAKLGAKKGAKITEAAAEKAPVVIEKIETALMKPITYPLKKGAGLVKKGIKKIAPEVSGVTKGIGEVSKAMRPAELSALQKLYPEAMKVFNAEGKLAAVTFIRKNHRTINFDDAATLVDNWAAIAGGVGGEVPSNIARVFTAVAPDPNWRLPHFDADFVVKETEHITTKFPGRVRGDPVQKVTKMAKLLTVRADEAGEIATNKIRETQHLIGRINQLIGADAEKQIVTDLTKVKFKPNAPQAIVDKLSGRPWTTGEVMEYYKYMDFTDPKAVEWIESAHKYLNELVEIITENGIDLPKLTFTDLDEFARAYYPRVVRGVEGLTEKELPRVGGTGARRIAGKMSHEKERMFDLMAEGIEKSVKYVDPLDALTHYGNSVYKRVGNEFAGRTMEQFFKEAPMDTARGVYAKWLADTGKIGKDKAKKLVDVIQRIKRGEVPHGATMADLKATFPQFERWLNAAVSMNTKDLPKFIGKLNNKFFQAYKITRDQFSDALKEMMATQIRGAKAKDNLLRVSDLNAVMTKLNVSNEWKRQAIRDFAEALSQNRKDLLNGMIERANQVLGVSKQAAKAARKTSGEIMDTLRRANLTEGYSPETAHIFKTVEISGKKYTGKYIEEQFKKIFTDKATGLFVIPETIAPLSRAFVTATAALDFSASMIQLPLMLGYDLIRLLSGKPTAIFAKSMKMMFESVVNPSTMRRFMNDFNHIYVEFGQHGFITGMSGVEFTQQLPRAAAKLQAVPKVGKVVGTLFEQTYGRFGYSFGAAGEVARVLYIDSMREAWKRAGHNPRELVNLANLMTGVVSSRAMGVTANSRAVESMALFAPRFIRSQLIVLGQLFSRGATANQVRKVFVGSLAAWGVLYYGACLATGNKPKFNPMPTEYGGDGSEFMSLTINGQVYGMPGWANLLRNAVTILAASVMTPDRYIKMDWETVSAMDEVKDDPLLKAVLRTLLAKAAPPLNFVKEMATGRDFLGRRFEDTDDYLMAALEKFIPIAAQSWVSKDQPNSYWAYAAEVLGLKTYPQSKWREFNEKMAPLMQEYEDRDDMLNAEQLKKLNEDKLNWYDLSAYAKFEVLKDHPEIKPLLDEAESESARYSTNEMAWYRDMKDQFDREYKEADAKEFEFVRDETKTYSIKDLRWKIAENKTKKYEAIQNLEKDPQYTDVLQPYFDRIDKMVSAEGNLTRYDKAQTIWFNYVLSDDDAVYDKMLDEDIYVERQRRIEWFRKTYPNEYEYIEESTLERLADQEPIYVKLHKDKLMLTDTYWKILNSEGDADKVGRMKYRKDPENWLVDALLNFWGYTSTVVNKDKDKVEKQIRAWCKEYNIPESKIPAFGAEFVPVIATEKYKVTQQQWAGYTAIINERADIEQYEKWKYLLANPELNAYMVAEEGKADARTKQLNIPESDAWLKQYEIYDNLRDENGKADTKKRKEYRLRNPEFDREGAKYGRWEILTENILQGAGKPGAVRTEPSLFGD